MPDLLVKLYELPPCEEVLRELEGKGFVVKRPIGPEKLIVVDWVKENFGLHWAGEVDASFSNKPISCFVAVDVREGDPKLAGFACYDATVRGFFGPTGVLEEYRGVGLGKALLLVTLRDMFNVGYAYAIIGYAGPVDFYRKAVGAIEIPESFPGIYRHLLR